MTLDHYAAAFYRVVMKNAFFERTGTNFETMFNDIMVAKHGSDFEVVRPYGNVGDKKCDGFLSSEKTVHQCYAPETFVQTKAIAKIKEDHTGAVNHWGKRMIHWRFVHNQSGGLPPDVVQLLHDSATAEVKVSSMDRGGIIPIALGLPKANLAYIFGPAPSPEAAKTLTFDSLRDIIDAIATEEPDPFGPLTAPSAKKLDANDFSDDVRMLIQLGQTRTGLVDNYFLNYPDPSLAEGVATAFRDRYQELRAEGLSADAIFHQLHTFAGGRGKTPQDATAIFAVLTYFFEKCDIFENYHEVADASKDGTS